MDGFVCHGLLPDCLAARLPRTLNALEAVVAPAERATSLAEANAVRRDTVKLPGAMPWVRRRMRLVHITLNSVIGLISDRLDPCVPNIAAVRGRLASENALTVFHALATSQLQRLPAPLRFHLHRLGVTDRKPAHPTQGGA